MSASGQLEKAFEALESNNEATLLCMYNDLNAKMKSVKYLSLGDHNVRLGASLMKNISAASFIPDHAKAITKGFCSSEVSEFIFHYRTSMQLLI